MKEIKYTLEEQDNATKLFLEQLKLIRKYESKNHIVAPIALEKLQILFATNELVLTISELDLEPETPEWMCNHYEDNLLQISCDANLYQNEILYFVMHIWREIKLHSDKDVNEVFIDAFGFLRERWSAQREPKSVEEQKGLIGELMALSWVIENKGEDFIDAWDASGHAGNDITAPSFNVEAKSKPKDSDEVRISFKEQLVLPEDKKLHLSVTDVSKNSTKGCTLPEFKEDYLERLDKSGCQRIQDIEDSIAAWGLSEIIEDRFTTTFVIGKTKTFEITEEDTCAIFGNLDLPSGIEIKYYILDLNSLSNFDP